MKLPTNTMKDMYQAQLLLFPRKIKSRIALAKLSLSALSQTTPPNISVPKMAVIVSARILALVLKTDIIATMATILEKVDVR